MKDVDRSAFEERGVEVIEFVLGIEEVGGWSRRDDRDLRDAISRSGRWRACSRRHPSPQRSRHNRTTQIHRIEDLHPEFLRGTRELRGSPSVT